MKAAFHKIRKSWKSGISYALRLSKVISPPIKFHIEITNICNFRCIYCPQSKPDEHFSIIGKGKMEYSDYKVIIDRITAAWNIDKVILTRDGEPLVHPELHEFVRYAADKGLLVSIGSNGSYFTQERVARLLENGLFEVKGDFCQDKEQFEQLRDGANWEEVLTGYRNLLTHAATYGKKFHLVLKDLNTYQAKTEEEISMSISKLRELFPYPPHLLSIGPAIMHNFLDGAKTILSSSSHLTKHKYNLCHHPWVEFVVDYKGNVVGCCRDLRSEYIVGNILEEEDIVKNIWNGERMRFLRSRLARQSPDSINTCSRCDLPYGFSYAGRGVIDKFRRFLLG